MTDALYLDVEFNGFGGELISIGLASTDGSEFYAEVAFSGSYQPWVADNVVPKLDNRQEELEALRHRLWTFLKERESQPVYADWPDDFSHLLRILSDNAGRTLPVNLTMKLIEKSYAARSDKPHHALSDAHGLKDWHLRVSDRETGPTQRSTAGGEELALAA